MDIATIVCPNGHLSVPTKFRNCKECGQGFLPIRIVTSVCHSPVTIIGYDAWFPELARVRYEDGTVCTYPQDGLTLLGVSDSEKVLSHLFGNGIITGK